LRCGSWTESEADLLALDLFSGIGGFALAGEAAGFEIGAFCEVDPFCRAVLSKHWPGVPIHPDIRSLRGRDWDRTPDIVWGGFPCQPYSVAGKRRGSSDDRDLWPEMRRVIDEFRPRWVCAENTPGFVGLGLDQAWSDLEDLGYEVGSVVLPALGVGAPHIRQRLFIIAHSEVVADTPRELFDGSGPSGTAGWNELANGDRPSVPGRELLEGRQREPAPRPAQWVVEPDVGRVAHGVPHRVDRLKALGNAVVPLQVVPVLRAIRNARGA